MSEKIPEPERRATQIYMKAVALVVEIVKKLYKLFGTNIPFRMANYEDDELIGFAIAVPTGFKGDETYWNIIKLTVPKREVRATNEDVNRWSLKMCEWKPFKFDKYYDRVVGETILTITDSVRKGTRCSLFRRDIVALSPYVVRRFGTTSVVVVNAKVGLEKALSLIFGIFANYFTQRLLALEAKVFDERPQRINFWRRLRMLFDGKLRSVYRSLNRLYNNIYYRVSILEEERRVSEPLVTTFKLLINLASSFTKLVDKYGIKIFNKVVAKKAIEFLKERVGFYRVPEFVKHIVAVWNEINLKWEYALAKKILRAKPAEG